MEAHLAVWIQNPTSPPPHSRLQTAARVPRERALERHHLDRERTLRLRFVRMMMRLRMVRLNDDDDDDDEAQDDEAQ